MRTQILFLLVACSGCSTLLRPPPASDLTTRQYRLGQCVAKSPVVLKGKVLLKTDHTHGSHIEVRPLWTLKGTLAPREITIHSEVHAPDFQKRFKAAPVQEVKTGQSYIFFLSSSTPTNGVFTLFNAFDGVMPYSAPVAREIRFMVTGRPVPQVTKDISGVDYSTPTLRESLEFDER